MKTVYLAGLISTDKPESLHWRARAGKALCGHFKILDPLRGKYDLASVSQDGGMTHPALSARDIILRDYNDICKSGLLLAHLDDFGSARPLVGTLIELGWAWQLHKPVIAIAAPGNRLMRLHPFVAECVAHYFERLEASIEFIMREYA